MLDTGKIRQWAERGCGEHATRFMHLIDDFTVPFAGEDRPFKEHLAQIHEASELTALVQATVAAADDYAAQDVAQRGESGLRYMQTYLMYVREYLEQNIIAVANEDLNEGEKIDPKALGITTLDGFLARDRLAETITNPSRAR